MKVSDLPELATPVEISKVLRCTPEYVRQQMASGRLRASKIAGKYLATQQAVTDFIEGSVIACPDPIPGPVSNGARIAASGKSSGMNGASSAARQRAQQIAEMLKGSSQTSSKPATKRNENPAAPVIPIR